mmetsp:Transcript_38387/g.99176  ORF Transcript_38387/g.99176 Transcript_38387/m.99176 type:complete len:165 (-) Transcript_38387:166-660(-)
MEDPCWGATPAYRVKNTFIDGFAEDGGEEDLGGMAMGKTRTSPARLLDDSTSKCEENREDEEEEEEEEVLGVAETSAATGIEPSEVRKPSMSLGSVGHSSRQCKPCGWYWRPQGCANGEECLHCHLCLPKDLKLRKKKVQKAKKAAACHPRRRETMRQVSSAWC